MEAARIVSEREISLRKLKRLSTLWLFLEGQICLWWKQESSQMSISRTYWPVMDCRNGMLEDWKSCILFSLAVHTDTIKAIVRIYLQQNIFAQKKVFVNNRWCMPGHAECEGAPLLPRCWTAGSSFSWEFNHIISFWGWKYYSDHIKQGETFKSSNALKLHEAYFR